MYKRQLIKSAKFIFGCRAFNAYIGAIEKTSHKTYSLSDVVDEETFDIIVALASSKSSNRDCRQVGSLRISFLNARNKIDNTKWLSDVYLSIT